MKLVKIQFAGEQFPVFKDEENIVWVALRPVVEYLGLDWAGQQKKLAAETRFSCRLMSTTGADRKTYEMWCMPVKKTPALALHNIAPKGARCGKGKTH